MNIERGIARSITWVLIFSVSLSGMPVLALADDSSSDKTPPAPQLVTPPVGEQPVAPFIMDNTFDQLFSKWLPEIDRSEMDNQESGKSNDGSFHLVFDDYAPGDTSPTYTHEEIILSNGLTEWVYFRNENNHLTMIGAPIIYNSAHHHAKASSPTPSSDNSDKGAGAQAQAAATGSANGSGKAASAPSTPSAAPATNNPQPAAKNARVVASSTTGQPGSTQNGGAEAAPQNPPLQTPPQTTQAPQQSQPQQPQPTQVTAPAQQPQPTTKAVTPPQQTQQVQTPNQTPPSQAQPPVQQAAATQTGSTTGNASRAPAGTTPPAPPQQTTGGTCPGSCPGNGVGSGSAGAGNNPRNPPRNREDQQKQPTPVNFEDFSIHVVPWWSHVNNCNQFIGWLYDHHRDPQTTRAYYKMVMRNSLLPTNPWVRTGEEVGAAAVIGGTIGLLGGPVGLLVGATAGAIGAAIGSICCFFGHHHKDENNYDSEAARRAQAHIMKQDYEEAKSRVSCIEDYLDNRDIADASQDPRFWNGSGYGYSGGSAYAGYSGLPPAGSGNYDSGAPYGSGDGTQNGTACGRTAR